MGRTTRIQPRLPKALYKTSYYLEVKKKVVADTNQKHFYPEERNSK